MGDERFGHYLQSFEEEPPVSIRLNPLKTEGLTVAQGEPVPWCQGGYYLSQRPNFTMDPLLHAGCYYVQEAASMFLDEVLCQMHNAYISHLPSAIRPLTALDLCAAPGGKSTLLRAVLPRDCVLYSNEPVRQRFSILLENITKWGSPHHLLTKLGSPNHLVTNCYPKAFRRSKFTFDLILCDVPCSGEGMFRKDAATISEWSPQQVEKCWQLQRDIVSDAWACLNPGGLLIYSTCTFNIKENEENIRWILENFEAEVVPIDIRPEWHITGSLLPDFHEPVYRFIPGISRGEGLFMCVLRKRGEERRLSDKKRKPASTDMLHVITPAFLSEGPQVTLPFSQAIAYLRGEALMLPPDTPRGMVRVCFEGHPLGLVKNIGSRANNQYPKEWRIKTTHIPEVYTPILVDSAELTVHSS